MSDLKKARLIHVGFVGFALIEAVIAYTLFSSASAPTTSYWLYAVLALFCANSGFYFRKTTKRMEPATVGPDGKARNPWFVGLVLCWASALAVVQCGLIAAMNTAFIYAVPFFVVGTALLLLWAPRAKQVPPDDSPAL